MRRCTIGLAIMAIGCTFQADAALGEGWRVHYEPFRATSDAGVACASTSWCIAAWSKTTLWDGTRWTIQPPMPVTGGAVGNGP